MAGRSKATHPLTLLSQEFDPSELIEITESLALSLHLSKGPNPRFFTPCRTKNERVAQERRCQFEDHEGGLGLLVHFALQAQTAAGIWDQGQCPALLMGALSVTAMPNSLVFQEY